MQKQRESTVGTDLFISAVISCIVISWSTDDQTASLSFLCSRYRRYNWT